VFSGFLRVLCVNVLAFLYAPTSSLNLFAFLFARFHHCLYQFSSAFIRGDFNNRNATDQPYARRATKNCANARNLPARSP
jgi:hypothetical protein